LGEEDIITPVKSGGIAAYVNRSGTKFRITPVKSGGIAAYVNRN
jgi:hypothetical protein